jgi:hypothetical protein
LPLECKRGECETAHYREGLPSEMNDNKPNNPESDLEAIRQQIDQLEKELTLLREQFEKYLERFQQRHEGG